MHTTHTHTQPHAPRRVAMLVQTTRQRARDCRRRGGADAQTAIHRHTGPYLCHGWRQCPRPRPSTRARRNATSTNPVTHAPRHAARAAASPAAATATRATAAGAFRARRSCSVATVPSGRSRLALACSSRADRTAQCATAHTSTSAPPRRDAAPPPARCRFAPASTSRADRTSRCATHHARDALCAVTHITHTHTHNHERPDAPRCAGSTARRVSAPRLSASGGTDARTCIPPHRPPQSGWQHCLRPAGATVIRKHGRALPCRAAASLTKTRQSHANAAGFSPAARGCLPHEDATATRKRGRDSCRAASSLTQATPVGCDPPTKWWCGRALWPKPYPALGPDKTGGGVALATFEDPRSGHSAAPPSRKSHAVGDAARGATSTRGRVSLAAGHRCEAASLTHNCRGRVAQAAFEDPFRPKRDFDLDQAISTARPRTNVTTPRNAPCTNVASDAQCEKQNLRRSSNSDERKTAHEPALGMCVGNRAS